MSIIDMEIAKELALYGERMNREGISQRAIDVAIELLKDPSYKGAIICIGKMIALGQACNWDGYWKEKREYGKQLELEYLKYNFVEYPIKNYEFPKIDIHQ